jgi:TusA-related sulfurtransferase
MKNIWRTLSVSFLGILEALPSFALLFATLSVITYFNRPTYSEWIESAAFIGFFVLLFFAVIGNLALSELSFRDQNTNKTHLQQCCLRGHRNGDATIDLSGKYPPDKYVPLSYLCVRSAINVMREGKTLTVINAHSGEMSRIKRLLELRGHTLLESTEIEGKSILRILVGKEQ